MFYIKQVRLKLTLLLQKINIKIIFRIIVVRLKLTYKL
jgi:hypothetical protein